MQNGRWVKLNVLASQLLQLLDSIFSQFKNDRVVDVLYADEKRSSCKGKA